MSAHPPDVAQRIATTIIEGFDKHYRLFRETSARAKERFEEGDWPGVQRAVRERIRFYDERVRECVARLREELGAETLDDEVWQRAKLLYIGLLVDHKRPELAETFFNSVVTRILERTYRHNDFIFVRSAISTEYIEADPPVYRSYYPEEGELHATFVEVLRSMGWRRPFADLERDVGFVLRALLEHLGGRWPERQPNFQVQVVSSAFYRNKAAFVIGRIVNGHEETPFVIPVLHDEEGRLVLDTVICDPEEISILFSLSRAYFMADMDVPSGTIEFLQAIMPTKPRSELYTAVGLAKQGKTLFYRDLRQHLYHSRDPFVVAPGTPGLVMHVFNLASYPYVFKVIKDVFGPTKTVDRETVKRKFQLVKETDRVGRMADAHEFTELALPLERFSPELLAELEELAPSTIEIEGSSLVLHHCYVERRLIPLDLYLPTVSGAELERVVVDYGNALRELAIANIFPGDLLWRNFGLTRYGRVVFYDYDEVEYLTDCVFRRIPPPPTPEAELADEPWYPIGPRDVFPEEFERFLLGRPDVREAFLRHHADLLRPEFWWECQERVARGEIADFFPYPESRRFRYRYADVRAAAAGS
jgi:isocitrate dehydrogenase kinase/phosphatase